MIDPEKKRYNQGRSGRRLVLGAELPSLRTTTTLPFTKNKEGQIEVGGYSVRRSRDLIKMIFGPVDSTSLDNGKPTPVVPALECASCCSGIWTKQGREGRTMSLDICVVVSVSCSASWHGWRIEEDEGVLVKCLIGDK